MPSSSVPDWLRRGRPSDRVASMWKCAIDEGRRDQAARGVDLLPALAFKARLDRGDLAALDADIDVLAAVGQIARRE